MTLCERAPRLPACRPLGLFNFTHLWFRFRSVFSWRACPSPKGLIILTLQLKHSECQFLFKASTYFSPPVIARIHLPHLTENRSSKHFSQYGLPESTRNPSLPKPRLQKEHTKWSGCQLLPRALIQFYKKKGEDIKISIYSWYL